MTTLGSGYVRVFQLETYGAEPTPAGVNGSKFGAMNDDAFEAVMADMASAGGGILTCDEPGTYYISNTIYVPDNVRIESAPGVTFKLARNSNCNMLRNTNWGSAEVAVSALSCSDGKTVTATCTHGRTVGTSEWRIVYGASPEAYNGVWYVTYTTSAAFTYRIAWSTPSETLTTPATGTIYSRLGNGNIEITGGTWDYDRDNQTTPDTWQSHALYLRRVANLYIHDCTVNNSLKYGIHVNNFHKFRAERIYSNSVSNAIQCGWSGKQAVIRDIFGTTGDDFIAFVQGDYVQYTDSGNYILGAFDDILIDGIYCDNSFDHVTLVPQGGYSWTNTTVRNVSGRFSGGSSLVTVRFDSGVVQADRTSASTVGTITNLVVDNVANRQSSSKPLIGVTSTVTHLTVNNVDVLLGNTTGTSMLLLVGNTGTVSNLYGNAWKVKGGGTSSGGIYVNDSGTLGNVYVNNFLFDTTGPAVTFPASSVCSGSLHFSNGVGTGMSTFFSTAVRNSTPGPIQFLGNNIRYVNPSGAFFTGGSGANAQLDAVMTGCKVADSNALSGSWINTIVDWLPEQKDTITYAATITPDFAKGSIKLCTFTGAMTIAAPTNVFTSNNQDGKLLTFILIRNSAGAAAITWNAAYIFPTAFTDSSSNTTRTVVQFRYDGNSKWVCVSGANSWQ